MISIFIQYHTSNYTTQWELDLLSALSRRTTPPRNNCISTMMDTSALLERSSLR